MEQGSILEDGRHGPGLCHHLQGPTQNPEQVGKQGVCGWAAALSIYGMSHRWGRAQPYPTSKFLLPISHNLEQTEYGNAVEGDGSNEATPVQPKEDVLLGDCQAKGQLEGITNSPSKQHEPVGPEPTGLTSLDSTNEGLHAKDDVPAPLRQSSRKIRNQLPLRYWNFAAWQNDIFPYTFNMWVGLCICLHIVSYLYTVFLGSTVWRHSTWTITGLPDTNDFWHWWGYHWCWLYGGFVDGRVEQRIFGPSAAAPLGKPKDNFP